jgi:hypothetical protein
VAQESAEFTRGFAGSGVRGFGKPVVTRDNRLESGQLVTSEYHRLRAPNPRTPEPPNFFLKEMIPLREVGVDTLHA